MARLFLETRPRKSSQIWSLAPYKRFSPCRGGHHLLGCGVMRRYPLPEGVSTLLKPLGNFSLACACVCVRARACACACVRACVCVCARGTGSRMRGYRTPPSELCTTGTDRRARGERGEEVGRGGAVHLGRASKGVLIWQGMLERRVQNRGSHALAALPTPTRSIGADRRMRAPGIPARRRGRARPCSRRRRSSLLA